MTPQSPRYTLHEQLRQRDLATVFSGIDNSTNMPTFVALLTDLAATDRAILSALRAELPVLQNADPSLITVLDYNLSTPPLYIMVEYLIGVSLRQLVEGAGRGLPAAEALAYCDEAARCVAAMHSRGVVHGAVHIDDFLLRDLNMVCVSAWVAELFGADLFATADLRSGHEPLDKHMYQPPERSARMGQPPNSAGDIYGLGILLYHLLTGVPPEVAPGSPELAAWLRGGQSPPLDESIADATLRSRLQKFIQVATSRDPMRRWPDLRTFITGLEQIKPGGTMSMPRITASSFTTPDDSSRASEQASTSRIAGQEPVGRQDSRTSQPSSSDTAERSPEQVPRSPSVLHQQSERVQGERGTPATAQLPSTELAPTIQSSQVEVASHAAQGQAEAQARPRVQINLQPVVQPQTQPLPERTTQLSHSMQPSDQSRTQPRNAYLISLVTGTVYPVSGATASVGVARTTNFFPDVNLAMEPPAQAQFVSQHHLDLVYDRGQWYVKPDNSARNPTFVNGTQVAPGSSQPIYEGMLLEIPSLALKFSFTIA